MTEIHYRHEPEATCIVAATEAGQAVGEIHYIVEKDYWNADRTSVDPEYRGSNIARNLVNMLADTARAEGVMILPTCPYAKHVMENDAAFTDVLFKHDTPRNSA